MTHRPIPCSGWKILNDTEFIEYFQRKNNHADRAAAVTLDKVAKKC